MVVTPMEACRCVAAVVARCRGPGGLQIVYNSGAGYVRLKNDSAITVVSPDM
jgi:chaperonin GroEL (HSP60 family)